MTALKCVLKNVNTAEREREWGIVEHTAASMPGLHGTGSSAGAEAEPEEKEL